MSISFFSVPLSSNNSSVGRIALELLYTTNVLTNSLRRRHSVMTTILMQWTSKWKVLILMKRDHYLPFQSQIKLIALSLGFPGKQLVHFYYKCFGLTKMQSQPHSSMNMYAKSRDLQNELFLNTISWVDLMKPKYCIFENVKGFVRYQLLSTQDGRHRVTGGIKLGGLKFITRALVSMG